MDTDYIQPQLFATSKRCSRCKQIAPVEMFVKGKRYKDGLQPWCKTCRREYDCEHRKKNAERHRAQSRARYAANPEKHKAYWKRSYERHKDKRRAYAREHYQENKEQLAERFARYYRENVEYMRARAAAWRLANPERHKQNLRNWYEANKEYAKQYARTYREANKDWLYSLNAERARHWKEANPERVRLLARQYSSRRRARLQDATMGTVSYRAILERDGHVCHICGLDVATDDVHFDHVIPLSKGGAHSMENIKVSHSKCNLRKAARLI